VQNRLAEVGIHLSLELARVRLRHVSVSTTSNEIIFFSLKGESSAYGIERKLHMKNHEFHLCLSDNLDNSRRGTAGRQTLLEETLAFNKQCDELWGSPRLLRCFRTTHPVTLEHELTSQLKN
jgi:hypothetical protein